MKVLLLSIFIIGHTGLFIANAAKNPDPARFSDGFEKFVLENTKEAKLTRPLTLFTGSSSIRRWDGLEKDFPQHNPLNRGFGGAIFPTCFIITTNSFQNISPKESSCIAERMILVWKISISSIREFSDPLKKFDWIFLLHP